LKYIPLIVVIFILITICLVGIVAIKAMVNMRDYGKLYLCGMKWSSGIRLSAIDMTMNCLLAGVLSFILVYIQKRFELFDRIFAEFRIAQSIAMISMFGIIIWFSVIVTGGILRTNTAMDMMKR
jgi:hypothetical protein